MQTDREHRLRDNLGQTFLYTRWPQFEEDRQLRDEAVLPYKVFAEQHLKAIAESDCDPLNYGLLDLWLEVYQEPWNQPTNLHKLLDDLAEKIASGELIVYLEDSDMWRHVSSTQAGKATLSSSDVVREPDGSRTQSSAAHRSSFKETGIVNVATDSTSRLGNQQHVVPEIEPGTPLDMPDSARQNAPESHHKRIETHADAGTALGKGIAPNKFKNIPNAEYSALRERSVHNPNSDTLILGKYDPVKVDGKTVPGPNSYITKAEAEGATYFDMGAEWNTATKKYSLTDDDMFEAFNIPVLDKAVSSGKVIKFTHNPREYGGFLEQEWDYLQRTHGYFDLEKIDGVWHAVK